MWLNKVTYWLKVTYSNTWFTKIYFRDKLHDGRGDYQALDHMHTRTKLSYVCARAKSLEHSLPLNWYVMVKRVRNELRVDTLQVAIYFFLSGRYFFYLHLVNTIGRWTKALHVEEIFESVQKITHKYATSNQKKKNDAKLQLDKYLVIRTFNL